MLNGLYSLVWNVPLFLTFLNTSDGFFMNTRRLTTSINRSMSVKLNTENGNIPFTQVISDVDDTLKSSGGLKIGDVALGGIDVQYARGDFYPGVFQFMLEMSRSTGDALSPPKVAILTARAEEFKVALELKDDSKLAVAFRKTGEAVGIQNWGLGPVLYGSVAEWVIQSELRMHLPSISC